MRLVVRPAAASDLLALTEIYNHYVVHTTITFDLRPFAPEERRGWFEEHSDHGRHRLLVACDADEAEAGGDAGGRIVGYATSGRWRPKAAYETTVETSVYCRADAIGRGIGTRLYSELFASLAHEDVHRIVAGVSLPNPASVALHERFGFRQIGVFSSVGRKFGRYWDVAWYERPLRVGDGLSRGRPESAR
jgi:phosphinothricin acetyltransferase